MPDRVIRDELLDSDRWLCLASDSERLAFVGLVLSCDDFGNLEGGAHRLFRFLSTFTQIKTPENVASVLMHLCDQDLIRRYEVDGRELIHIPRLRPHRDYLVRKFPPSPWCDPEASLGKHKRIYNKGLAKNVATTSHKRRSDVVAPSDQGVGVGVGENLRERRAVDNFSPIGKVTHAVASNLKGKNARWWETPESIEAKGKELGIEAHKGETMAAYKDRLFKAIQHAERSQA